MNLLLYLVIGVLTLYAVIAMQVYFLDFVNFMTITPTTTSIYEGDVPFTPTSFSDSFTLQDGRIFTPQQRVVITAILVYYSPTINSGISYRANLWSEYAHTIMESIEIPASTSTTAGWIAHTLLNQYTLNKNENYYITLSYTLNTARTIFSTNTPYLPYTNNGVTLGYRVSSTTTGFPDLLGNNSYQTNNILAIDMQFYS